MAITRTSLTSGRDSTDLSSYSTAAFTPSASTKLVLVSVLSSKGSTPEIPTISGGGLATWVQVDTVLRGSSQRQTLFRGMGTPGAAAPLVIDFAGGTQTSCAWTVGEYDGVDTSGTNGSGAVLQAGTTTNVAQGASGTSVTITLAAFGSPDNGVYCSVGHNANEVTTAGSGFTKAVEVNGTNPATALMTQWRADNDTSVDASWSTPSNYTAIAIELKAAAGASTQTVTASGIIRTPTIGTPVVGVGIKTTQLAASRDSTDSSTYSTASVAVTANALLVVAIFNTKASAPDIPAISGGGVSQWFQVESVVRNSLRLTIWVAQPAAPGAAAPITFTFPAAQTSCAWSVDQFTGVATGATAMAAIVQEAPNSGPSAGGGSVPLLAFSSPSNATYGAFGQAVNQVQIAGSGFTAITQQNGSNPQNGLMVEWRGDNDTSVDATWASASQWVGFGMELKAGLPTSNQTVIPDGIQRTAALGTPTLVQQGRIVPAGIVRTAEVGEPTISIPSAGTVIIPIGIERRTTLNRVNVGTPYIPSNIPPLAEYDYHASYPQGSLITDEGRIFQATNFIPKGVPPAGAGDGSAIERARLLRMRHGYAKDVTGGNAGPTVVVSSVAASGAGTLKAALEASGPAWIIFDPALGEDVLINLNGTQILPKPNKTVDGRGRRVRVKGGSIFYKGNIEGIIANLIYTYVEFLEVKDVSTQFLNFGANGNGNTHGGADLVWAHHCQFRDNRDTMISGGFFGTNESRFTVDWCLFGPNPGPMLFTRKPLGGGSDWNTGKAANFGFDKTLAVNGVDGDELTVGYGKITYSNNWFKNCVQRQPKGAGTYNHIYNCLWTEWGLPDGTISVAIEPDTNGEYIVENCVFRPYNTGDAHWFQGYTGGTAYPVSAADKDAIKNQGGTGFKLKATNNLYYNSAVAIANVNAGSIFSPTYGYTTASIDDYAFPVDEVEGIVSAGAGNFQAWRDMGPTSETASLLNQMII